MRALALLLVPSIAWACPKLEPIGKLYDAYAAEVATQSGLDLDLPAIDGKPVKLVDTDLVVVGPLGNQIYGGDGEREHTDEPWTKRAPHAVIAPERKATYAQIKKALLVAKALGYADVAIGYRAWGVLHGRPAADARNIPAWGVAFHKQLAEHCPELVEIFERDPMAASTVAAAAPLVRGCSCEIDARYLEQWPVLAGAQLLTTVPLAAKAAPPRDAQVWGELVKGKPVPLALPELAAPTPPPPPPHR